MKITVKIGSFKLDIKITPYFVVTILMFLVHEVAVGRALTGPLFKRRSWNSPPPTSSRLFCAKMRRTSRFF